MVRVPQYSSQVSFQGQRATQSISTPASAFGASEAAGVSALGQGVDLLRQRAQRIQQENDETRALEAYNQASSRIRALMSGEDGFLNRQGRDAYEGYEALQAEVDRVASEAATGLTPAQARAFGGLFQSRRESALNSAATHAGNQRRAYRDEQANAVAADAAVVAAESWATPGAIIASQANAAVAITTAMAGRPDEVIVAARDAMVSSSWMAAIEGAQAAGQYDAAERIFEQYGDQIRGQDRTRAAALIEEGGLRIRGQQGADAVWDRFGEDTRAGLRFIRDNYEGRDRDEIQRRYLEQFRIVRETRAETRDANFGNALGYVEGGGRIDDIPPAIWVGLSATEREYIETRARGFAIQSDVGLYLDVLQNPQNYADDPEALVEARSRLNEDDFNRARTAVDNFRNGVDSTAIRTPALVASNIINELGIDPTRRRGAAEARAITSAVETRMREHLQHTGRQMTPQEVDNMVVGIVAERRSNAFNKTPVALERSGVNQPRSISFPAELQPDVVSAMETAGQIRRRGDRGQAQPSPSEINQAYDQIAQFAADVYGVDELAPEHLPAVSREWALWFRLPEDERQRYIRRVRVQEE